MTLSVDPSTYVISVPKADLTLISGTIYSLDTDVFRLELKAWEDDEEGIVQTKTHNHNTEVVIAGVTYARAIDILTPYSIEFEDGQYTVILQGSNNNIFDVENGILVQNQVQIISTNSAGLITVVSGSGVTAQDKLDIADRVWDEMIVDHTDSGSTGEALDDVSAGASPSLIADAVLDEIVSEHTDSGSLGDVVADILTDTGTTIPGTISNLQTAVANLLGLVGQNIKWTNLSHDANNNLTAATLTYYTDNTLVTPVKAWTLAATYNANSELTSHQLVEV